MSALLPVLLVVPAALAFVFETPLIDELNKLTKPNDAGEHGPVGRAIVGFRVWATKKLDRTLAKRSRVVPGSSDGYWGACPGVAGMPPPPPPPRPPPPPPPR